MSDTGKLKDKAITIAVINELRELIEIVFSNAELESKDGGKSKNLFMYRSDITISNNQIYFEADQLKLAFVNINTFNSVKITDQVVIGEVDLWISNMIKSGIKISGEGVALRNDLMDTYMAKISLLESYIYHRDVNAKVKLMGL